jgi:hypothetical protein
MRKALFLLLVMGFFLLAGESASADQAIYFASDFSAQGAVVSFSNPGPYAYLRIASVERSVSRLRIIDSRNFVFFDGRPVSGDEFYLPAGIYIAIVWSTYGSRSASALQGIFCQEPNAPMNIHDSRIGKLDPRFESALSESRAAELQSLQSEPESIDSVESSGPMVEPVYDTDCDKVDPPRFTSPPVFFNSVTHFYP